jgi:hypothetical protein
MPQYSHFPKSTRKQIIICLLAFAVAACAMLGLGMIRSGKAQDSLQKYEDLSVVPIEKRRAAFSNASPKDKSDLFRTHLAIYLARHAELTEDQRRIILKGISLATPQLYEQPLDNADSKAKTEEQLRQFQVSVLSGFSRDQGAKIFATMGDLAVQDDLFQKYREISALPMRERKAAFKNALPQDKSDLWRIHLALYIAKHPELSEAQIVIILEGMSLVRAELFDVPFDSPEWKPKVKEPLKRFENHILGVFSKEEAARVFATIGDAQNPSDIPRVKLPSTSQVFSRQSGYESRGEMFVLTRFATKNSLAWADCACNRSESWCGSNASCRADTCETTQYGCGYFWLNTCNGGCIDNHLD